MEITRPEWVKHAIFYQIFPERFDNGDPSNDPPGAVPWNSKPTRENFFGGDLKGILDKLNYLQDLGVNALYLNPIFLADTNHKYDTADYYQIDPAFGDLELFRELVEESHKRHIRVVLDAVFNHCGYQFQPFADLRVNGPESAYKDWFLVRQFPIQTSPPSYQTCGGTWYLPKLNVGNPAVDKFLLDVGCYWIKECDIDGWRLDVPWKVPLTFWRKFRKAVKDIKPDVYIVGEAWRWPDEWLDGTTCDGVMNYTLRDHVLDYCVYDHMDAEDFHYELERLLGIEKSSAYFQLNLLGGHDTPRIRTLCKQHINRQKLALIFLFTFPGSPMIYYGDEIGMEGENDPDCRRAMIWDREKWNRELSALYRQLIRIRREQEALQIGRYSKLMTFNGVYSYLRYSGKEQVIVILNPREEQSDLVIPIEDSIQSDWEDLLTGRKFKQSGSRLYLDTIGSESGLILIKNER